IIKSRPVIERTVVNLNLDRYPSFLKVNNERSIWEAIEALKGGEIQQVQKNDQLTAAALKGEKTEQGQKDDQLTATAFKEGETKPGEKDDQLAPGRNQVAEGGTGGKPKDPDALSASERGRLAPYVNTVMDNLKVETVRDTRFLRLSF